MGGRIGQQNIWIVVIHILVLVRYRDCKCLRIDNLITGPKGVEDSSLTASSYYEEVCLPKYVRIPNDYYAWCPAKASKSEYLQVEFKHLSGLLAFIIQGRPSTDQYINSLTIRTSLDGSSWINVTDTSGNLQIFQANTDPRRAVTITMDMLLAKFVRIHPETWLNWPSCHLEIRGCEKYVGPTCWVGKIGVPDNVLNSLHKTLTPHLGFCGKECNNFPLCKSFMFNSSNKECQLYDMESLNPTTVATPISALSRKVYFVQNPSCIPSV